jgi:hypothetical protein
MDDGIGGVFLLLFVCAGLMFAGFMAGRGYEGETRDLAACEAQCAPARPVVRAGVCGCVVEASAPADRKGK